MNGLRQLYARWKCAKHPGARVDVIENGRGDAIAAQCGACFRVYALSALQNRVLSLLRAADVPMAPADVSERLGVAESTAEATMQSLARHGAVQRGWRRVHGDVKRTRVRVFSASGAPELAQELAAG